MRCVVRAVLLGLTMLLGPFLGPVTDAAAQAYPTKPVSLLIAFPPGGPSDVLSRIVGKKLEQILGQPFIMDNRPGAGGNIAAEAAALAPADGHTHADGQQLDPRHQRRALQEDQFRSRARFRADQPGRLAGQHPGGQSERAGEDAGGADRAVARQSRQVQLRQSSGHGTAAHLAAELFKAEAKVDITHVPYKGGAPALTDVIAGHVQMIFATAASVVPHIQSGKVRALAVTPIKRTAVFPELATIDELGLKGFDATTWHGLVAPSKTPREIVARLHKATVEALNDPAVRKSLVDLGVDIVGDTPEEFAAYIKAEIPKWTAIVKASGAKLD